MAHFARLLEFEGMPTNFVALHAIANEGKPKRASLYVLYWYYVDHGPEVWQILFVNRREAEQSFRDACVGVFLGWRKADTWLFDVSGGGCLEHKPKATWTEVQLPEWILVRELGRKSWSRNRKDVSKEALDKAIRELDEELSNSSFNDTTIEVLMEKVYERINEFQCAIR